MQPLYITVTDNTGRQVHTRGRGRPVTSIDLDIYGRNTRHLPAVLGTIHVSYHPDPGCYTLTVRKSSPNVLCQVLHAPEAQQPHT